MNAKEYFERVAGAERRLYLIRKQREHWEDMVSKLSSVSDIKIRSTNIHSPTEEAAEHLVDLTRDLEAEEARYTALVREAKEVIDKIPQERFRTVLTLRYICGHSWRTIWDEMDYTGSKSVYKVHGYALREAQKWIPKETK